MAQINQREVDWRQSIRSFLLTTFGLCIGVANLAAVELQVQRVGDNVVASWPAAATNFFLQVSTDLNDPSGWRNADDIPVSKNGTTCSVAVALGSQEQFFRLKSWDIIFNGTSTAALRAYRQPSFPSSQWTVTSAGELKSVVGSGSSHIVTRKQYDNFELVWEWKTGALGNSGVMIRVTENYSDAYMSGPEYQLIDDAGYSLPPNQGTGAVYGLIAPVNRVVKSTGQWNQCRIVVSGNSVEHWLNGNRVAAYQLNSPAFQSLVAGSSFSSYAQFGKASIGYIAFQDWTPEVWYRNIKARSIP